MNQPRRQSCIGKLLYLTLSAVAIVVLLAIQYREFKRFDYNFLLTTFVVVLVWKVHVELSLFRWLSGLAATYLFCIADYLVILAFNRFIFAYDPIGGFHDWIDLAVLVPYLSMAPVYFVAQSILWRLGSLTLQKVVGRMGKEVPRQQAGPGSLPDRP